MSFLKIYDSDYRERLAARSEGFRMIFEMLEARNQSTYTIVETGTTRMLDNWQGDGQSTRLFDAFVNYHDGGVFSVDIDFKAVALAESITSPKTCCIWMDSVKYLHSIDYKIDLLYLDSFDFDQENPGPSIIHHMKELTAVAKYLVPGMLVAVDDSPGDQGKGYLVADYFAHIGVPLIHDGYQKVWQL